MKEFILGKNCSKTEDQDEAEMMGSGSDYDIAVAYVPSPVKGNCGNSQ